MLHVMGYLKINHNSRLDMYPNYKPTKMRRTSFKRCELFQYVLCRRDYAERLVASFANQIKSEYHGGNKSVSIESIALEKFWTLPKTDIN